MSTNSLLIATLTRAPDNLRSCSNLQSFNNNLRGLTKPAVMCDKIIPFPKDSVKHGCATDKYASIMSMQKGIQNPHKNPIWMSFNWHSVCIFNPPTSPCAIAAIFYQRVKVTDLFNHQLRREEKPIPALCPLQFPSSLSCHKFPTWLQKSQRQAHESELPNPKRTDIETLDIALPTGCNPNPIVTQWPQIANLIAKHNLINFA